MSARSVGQVTPSGSSPTRRTPASTRWSADCSPQGTCGRPTSWWQRAQRAASSGATTTAWSSAPACRRARSGTSHRAVRECCVFYDRVDQSNTSQMAHPSEPIAAYCGAMTMTQTDALHQVPTRLDVDAAIPSFNKAMAHLDTTATRELDRVGFPRGLRDLVRLRASQINGCAYCVDMHSKDAATNGESAQRINAVAI